MINQLLEVFANKLHRRVGSADTDLFETGLLDSLGLIELLYELEQNWGVTISLADLDLQNLRTVRMIANLVETNRC